MTVHITLPEKEKPLASGYCLDEQFLRIGIIMKLCSK